MPIDDWIMVSVVVAYFLGLLTPNIIKFVLEMQGYEKKAKTKKANSEKKEGFFERLFRGLFKK